MLFGVTALLAALANQTTASLIKMLLFSMSSMAISDPNQPKKWEEVIDRSDNNYTNHKAFNQITECQYTNQGF